MGREADHFPVIAQFRHVRTYRSVDAECGDARNERSGEPISPDTREPEACESTRPRGPEDVLRSARHERAGSCAITRHRRTRPHARTAAAPTARALQIPRELPELLGLTG
jgi:hypothetical protein